MVVSFSGYQGALEGEVLPLSPKGENPLVFLLSLFNTSKGGSPDRDLGDESTPLILHLPRCLGVSERFLFSLSGFSCANRAMDENGDGNTIEGKLQTRSSGFHT